MPESGVEQDELTQERLHMSPRVAEDSDLSRLEPDELVGLDARVATGHKNRRGLGEAEGASFGEEVSGLVGGKRCLVSLEEFFDCQITHGRGA